MGFSSIGLWEIGFILIIALIIWGPNKLPEIARTLGKAVRALKKASFDLTTAVTKEIESENTLPPPQQNTKTAEAPSEPKKTAKSRTLRDDGTKDE